MKKMLSWVVVLMFMCAMATTTAAGDAELLNEPKLDTSVFNVPDDLDDICTVCDCMDIFSLKINHFYNYIGGFTFFCWSGGDEKMPEHIEGTCFDAGGHGASTVVFSNGVPNLVNDLFKAWEGTTQDVYIPDSVKEIEDDCFVKGSTIKLHFTENNAVALAYAKARGMAFEVMDAKERLPGDANFDKSADMKDVLTLRQLIARIPTAYEIGSTDVNGDGSTDMKDVLALRQEIAVVVE